MEDGPQRQNIALALLAVLTGAIVQVASTDQPFTPWHSIVGLIMVASAQAYGNQIAKEIGAEAVAFAMIFAAGIVFSMGFILDQVLAKFGVAWLDPASGKPIAGFISPHLEDDVYFVIWICLSVFVLFFRSTRRKSPHI